MTIALAKGVEDFLQAQVRAGVSADPSKRVNDLLSSVRTQQQKPFKLAPELESWLLQAADQPAAPLTEADFEGLREWVRRRQSCAA